MVVLRVKSFLVDVEELQRKMGYFFGEKIWGMIMIGNVGMAVDGNNNNNRRWKRRGTYPGKKTGGDRVSESSM